MPRLWYKGWKASEDDLVAATSMLNMTSSTINPQTNCPLFSKIPAEIRDRIYDFTLTASDDPTKPFNPRHHHYRPGHKFRPKYDFALLRTCKRIYNEARLLPITLNEVVIYLYRGPRTHLPKSSQYDWRERYGALNPEQRDAVQTVHFFAQQCYLESTANLLGPDVQRRTVNVVRGPSEAEIEAEAMMAKRFVLTFRHSDWWSWESPVRSNDQLGICPWRPIRTNAREMEAEPLDGPGEDRVWNGWGNQFRYVKGLEVLEIEFETVETKRAQLERVVERAKHWRFPLNGDKVLTWTGGTEEWEWEGVADLREDNGDRAVQLRSVNRNEEDVLPATRTLVVIQMTWKIAQREQAA
jgi:hypothetical protein